VLSFVDATTGEYTNTEIASSTTTGFGPVGVPCSTRGLAVSLGGGSAATGRRFFDLVFRNVSGSNCHLTGYPGVSFLNAAGDEVGARAQRSNKSFTPVTLVSGGRAYAELVIVNPDVPPCPPATVQTIRIYPPNEKTPAILNVAALSLRVCAGQLFPAGIGPVVNHATQP
jgi:Protein of unknown function (DUF4232)